MKLTIKRLEVRDIGAAVMLLRQLFNESESDDQHYPIMDDVEMDAMAMIMLQTIDSPQALYLIAYDGKKPIGVFIGEICQRAYGRPRVFGVARDLYVVPDKRGQNVGMKMLAIAGQYAKAIGLDTIETIARPGKAQGRWEKYGFKPYLVNSVMKVQDARAVRGAPVTSQQHPPEPQRAMA